MKVGVSGANKSWSAKAVPLFILGIEFSREKESVMAAQVIGKVKSPSGKTYEVKWDVASKDLYVKYTGGFLRAIAKYHLTGVRRIRRV